MKKLLLIALSTFAVSAHAWDPSYYAGSNLASWQLSQTGEGSNFSISSIEGVAGARLHRYISVEGRAGFGLTTGREAVGNVTTSVTADYYGSLYFRPVIDNDKASLYGLLGYTMVGLDIDPALVQQENEQAGASFGIGVSFVMNPNVDVTAEWKKLINADNVDMRGGSVGFTYTF